MKKKHLIALMLIFVMLLTACGDKGGDVITGKKDKDQNITPAAQNTDPTQPAQQEPTPTESGSINPFPTSAENNPDEDPDKDYPATLSKLAMNKKYLIGVTLREKVDFSYISNLLEACTDITSFRRALFSRSLEDNLTAIELSDSNKVVDIFKQADELKKLGDPVVINVVGDVTIDGNKIINYSGFSTNEDTSLRGINLVVKTGSTLTITSGGMCLRSGYDDYEQPLFLVENGAKVIINDSSYILGDETFFIVGKGGNVEITDSTLNFLSIINLGNIKVVRTDVDSYNQGCFVSEDDFFYNGPNAAIYIDGAGFQVDAGDYQYRYGWYVGEYDAPEYGTCDAEEPTISDYIQHNPKAYNFGLIEVNGLKEQGLDFTSDAYNDEVYKLMPAVNLGTINLTGYGRHQMGVRCHFQNYGTINISGSLDTDRWGDSESILYGYSAFFENYGTIESGTGKGFAISFNELFINYKGGVMTEKRPKKYATLKTEGLFFTDVDPVTDYVEPDARTLEMINDDNWKSLYYAKEADDREIRIKFNSYKHKLTVDISCYIGDRYYSLYKQYLIYELLDGDKIVIKDYDEYYGGNTVITIIPNDTFSTIEYTITNDTYGEKRGRIDKNTD